MKKKKNVQRVSICVSVYVCFWCLLKGSGVLKTDQFIQLVICYYLVVLFEKNVILLFDPINFAA